MPFLNPAIPLLREIERKFIIPKNKSLLTTFKANCGNPPFKSLKHIKAYDFRDTYFDFQCPSTGEWVLEEDGVWIRKRGPEWEAKIRVKEINPEGDKRGYLKSTFKEITSVKEIDSLLRRYFPASRNVGSPGENFGLGVTCDFVTYREEWKLDDKFGVVLDRTDFGHEVGEVEVMASENEKDSAYKEIDEFMNAYEWFFFAEKGKPKGKISAYFDKFQRGERKIDYLPSPAGSVESSV